MANMSATLNTHVNYRGDYSEVGVNGYNLYRNRLNNHLQGERGVSLLGLICNTHAFNPQDVGMGLTPACPMSLRRQIVAQHNYRANTMRRRDGQDPANDDSIRITNLMAATLGMAFSLTYRVIRTALRTIFAIITVPYALHQQQRYNVRGWAKEDLRRIGWEWMDVCVTILTFFSGIINTFHPNAIKLDSLRDYYVSRNDQAMTKNQEFAAAKRAYILQRQRVSTASGAADQQIRMERAARRQPVEG